MHARDRGHSARRPEQVEAVAAFAVGDAGDERSERLVDMSDHIGEDLRRDRFAAVGLGERDDPQTHRFPRFDAPRAGAHARHPDDFRRTAPDVEQDRRFGVLVRKLAAAGRSQKGLGFPIDYLELEPQALANLGEKLRAVLGGSARLGRDQAGARDPSRAHLVPADPQRVERARDRRFRQPTCLRQSLAQANDARKRIDHAKAFRRRPRDEQPAIVRAQVQRGVEPLRRAAPRRPVGGGEFRRRRGIWAQRRRLSQFQTPSAPARGPRSERTFEIERSIVRKGCKSFCALVKMLRRGRSGGRRQQTPLRGRRGTKPRSDTRVPAQRIQTKPQ